MPSRQMQRSSDYHRQLKVAVKQAEKRARDGEAGGGLSEQVAARLEVVSQASIQRSCHMLCSSSLQ